MSKNELPVSRKQILYLALAVFVPLLFAVAVIWWRPSTAGDAESDQARAAAVLAVMAIGLGAIVAAAAHRRAVELDADVLVIRHSVYTLALDRSRIASAAVKEVATVEELGLRTRANGIAAFGYLSGWFRTRHGQLMFCAISAWPVYHIALDGEAECKEIALSASPELARRIAAWVQS
ncbi:hypothetical protein [Massilia sp. METH4]|uniref:hypothetical protein n=1 Tax=Massilia sp. METH4 TaxID=3123041 RepID=UPI0030CDC369